MSSAGDEVVDLARTAGLVLEPWQEDILYYGCGERPDGKWAAFECGEVVPRQNGKNGVLEARQLAGLFLFKERLQVHTAHEFKTSLGHFRRIKELIEGHRDFSKRVRIIRTGSADMSVELLNGQLLKFVARSDRSGAGLSGDTVYLDEAWALSAEMLGALVFTLRAVPNAQIWYASSGPHASSAFLHGLLTRAERGTGMQRNDYAGRYYPPKPGEPEPEPAAPANEPRLFVIAWESPYDVDPYDQAARLRVNPAVGHGRLTLEGIDDELRLFLTLSDDGLEVFIREGMGVREPPVDPTTLLPQKVAEDAWALTAVDVEVAVDRWPEMRSLAYDVSKGSEWASIAVASGSITEPYVEVIEHRRGTHWLPARIVELCKTHDLEVVYTNGAGAAPATVGPILGALEQALDDEDGDGLWHEVKVKQLNAGEYRSACEGMFTAMTELVAVDPDAADYDPEVPFRPALRRPAEGQDPLDAAVAVAVERPLQGSFAWDTRDPAIPITPLTAASMARAMLPLTDDQADWAMFATSSIRR